MKMFETYFLTNKLWQHLINDLGLVLALDKTGFFFINFLYIYESTKDPLRVPSLSAL